jgi:hypothetical protein
MISKSSTGWNFRVSSSGEIRGSPISPARNRLQMLGLIGATEAHVRGTPGK